LPPGDLTLATVRRALPHITVLSLGSCPWIDDLAPVSDMRLEQLLLVDSTVRDMAPLESRHDLLRLRLNGSCVDRIDGLAKHARLFELDLSRTVVADLGPLAENRSIAILRLDGCKELLDLGPLAALPNLTAVGLRGARTGLDLSPLAGKKVTIRLYEGQGVRGLDALGRRPTIEWSTPPEESTTT